VIEQLLPAARDRMRIYVQKGRQDRIAPAPHFDRFQAGEQAALLFVEQAIKQQNGRFEFIGRDGQRGGVGHQRDRVRRATRPDLILRAPRVGSGIQKPTGDVDAAQPPLPHQIVQRILHVDVEPVGEFIGEPALRRTGGPRLERVHERAVPREPHRLVGPQAIVVKAGDLAERIEPAAMGIAGQIPERLQLAEDREIGRRAQRLFECRQVRMRDIIADYPDNQQDHRCWSPARPARPIERPYARKKTECRDRDRRRPGASPPSRSAPAGQVEGLAEDFEQVL
jgi:hypothetical protein